MQEYTHSVTAGKYSIPVGEDLLLWRPSLDDRAQDKELVEMGGEARLVLNNEALLTRPPDLNSARGRKLANSGTVESLHRNDHSVTLTYMKIDRKTEVAFGKRDSDSNTAGDSKEWKQGRDKRSYTTAPDTAHTHKNNKRDKSAQKASTTELIAQWRRL